MNKCLLISVLLIPSVSVGQRFKIVELKPIINQGLTYYYDGKKIHGGAYGLQVPLLSLDDAEVKQNYQAFHNWQSVSALTSIVPALYLISLSRNQLVNQNEFWLVFGGSIVASLGCQLVAYRKINKGIERYNTLIITPSSQVIGPSIIYRF